MKSHRALIFSGALILALSFLFTACSGATPTPIYIVVTATPEDTPVPTGPVVPVLEVTGPAQTKTLTMEELKALPATEGYAGIKSSTGKITPPITMKGVALKDMADFIGGMDDTTGFNVLAEDGYSITFSYDQIQNGSFIAYDPATTAELKNPVPLTAIVAYEVDGQPFDAKQDGALRLAIISPELNQVTDGHWSVKWVNKLEVKDLGEDWVLHAQGGLQKDIDRGSFESCSAPQCHGSSWVDDKDQVWAGVPLFYLVGKIDDGIEHEGPAFNRDLAAAGYTVNLVAEDGYTVTFDAARVAYNKDILVAYKVNDNKLPDQYFPLRLVGDALEKNEMAGMIKELSVAGVPEATPVVSTPAPTSAAPAAAAEISGSLVITGLVQKPMGFTEADLRALEVIQITAEHPKKGTQEYQGIALSTLLDMAEVNPEATKLVITAADGYAVEVSLADARDCPKNLVAFTDTPEKFFLVMPDLESAYWVKDVAKIELQ